MIVQHLIDAGLIGPSEDNSHLDARNAEIAARAQAARDNFTGRPRLGDFVIMPSGKVERCCAAWDDGMQTTEGGSWHVSTSGTCSFSGGLNASQLWESFKPTEETRLGRFWLSPAMARSFEPHGVARQMLSSLIPTPPRRIYIVGATLAARLI